MVLLQHFIFAAGSNAVQIASEGMGGLFSPYWSASPLLIILFFTLIPSRCFSMFSNAFLTLIALSSYPSLVTAQTTNIFTYLPGTDNAGSAISNVTFEIGTIVTLSWETDFANVILTAFQGLWQGAYYYTQLLSTN